MILIIKTVFITLILVYVLFRGFGPPLSLSPRWWKWYTSPSGKYDLIEVVGAGGDFITYCVASREDTSNKVIFTTDEWYSGNFQVKGLWAKKTDDFIVISSDTGSCIYINERNTWHLYYFVYNFDNDHNLYWDGTIKDNEGNIRNYDINNLPDEERRYLDKLSKIL
jgi:hypothetical protein